MKQLNMISIPAMPTSGTLAVDLPGPGDHHAALHGIGDGGGAPLTVVATPTLVYIIHPLKPACSRIGTNTSLKTVLLHTKGA